MLETLRGIAQAWREILHVSELTGLSVGALGVIAFVVWFDPDVRKLAIRFAVLVVYSYLVALFFLHLGAGDVRAEWANDNLRAAGESEARDVGADKTLATDFDPQIQANRKQADSDDHQILADLSAVAATNCELGPRPLRLRNRSR
jgi:hypothetical protein